MATVLYLSYDGLLDPLGQSQILPYLEKISAGGHSLTIISHEKIDRAKEQIEFFENKLKKIGVSWKRLEFRPGKWWAIKRFINGAFLIKKNFAKIYNLILYIYEVLCRQ